MIKNISFSKYYNKDNILFYKNDISKYVYFLSSGLVRIYTHTDNINNKELTIDLIKAPNFILASCPLSNKPYNLNCMVLDKSEIQCINKDIFLNDIIKNNNIKDFLITVLVKDRYMYEDFIDHNLNSTSEIKILSFLFEYEQFLDMFSQKELASFLNFTPEFFSKSINNFINIGIIIKQHGFIKIVNYNKLKEIIF